MRALKTYLFVAPVLSTLWLGSLAGLGVSSVNV